MVQGSQPLAPRQPCWHAARPGVSLQHQHLQGCGCWLHVLGAALAVLSPGELQVSRSFQLLLLLLLQVLALILLQLQLVQQLPLPAGGWPTCMQRWRWRRKTGMYKGPNVHEVLA